ncbi:MAG TPA: fumarylacetoacetate hydrolase family protein [Euzebyales bacterium]|nr:fumarylacetoacetate hydrolase family protein [Euzebyales bacterium]
MNDVKQAAAWLRDASRGGDPIDLLTPHPSLELDDGYEIQDCMLADRRRDGEIVVGAAVAAIGRTIPPTMAAAEPLYRWLTDAMHVDAGTTLARSSLLRARVRPEIAFIVDRDMDDPATSAADVMASCSAVLPALVVVDYRLRQPVVRPADVVAVCAATSRFVLGETPVDLGAVDVAASRCVLEHNGEVVITATGAELPGHPADAVAWLVRQLSARGGYVESGMIVLSGGLNGSVPVDAGDTVTARFDRIGDVQLRCR